MLGEGSRSVIGVIRQTGKCVGAAKVVAIVDSAQAPIGHIETKFQDVLSTGPSRHFAELHVLFRLPQVGLCTARGEGILHDDLRSLEVTLRVSWCSQPTRN